MRIVTQSEMNAGEDEIAVETYFGGMPLRWYIRAVEAHGGEIGLHIALDNSDLNIRPKSESAVEITQA